MLINQNRVTIAFHKGYPIPDDDLENKLKTKGYVVPKEPIVVRIGADGSQNSAKRWERKGVEVYYIQSKGLLSAEGRDLEKVSECFNEIHEIAKDLLGQDLAKETKWAEVFFDCRYLGAKRPLKALEDYLPSQPYLKLGEIVGEKVKPFSLIIYSAEKSELEELEVPLKEVPNWVHINIEPLIINSKYYFVRVIYRQEDISKVGVFNTKLGGVVDSLISQIESDSDVSTE
ncbi:MAG TPA: hypothetical protein ENI73_02635 [Spirochaetes bacterium]|nr:hypothetical protein [Spirochaetota bacterium]